MRSEWRQKMARELDCDLFSVIVQTVRVKGFTKGESPEHRVWRPLEVTNKIMIQQELGQIITCQPEGSGHGPLEVVSWFPLRSPGGLVADPCLPFLQSGCCRDQGDPSGVRWETKGFSLPVLHGFSASLMKRSVCQREESEVAKTEARSSVTDSASDLPSPVAVPLRGERIARNLSRNVLRKQTKRGH